MSDESSTPQPPRSVLVTGAATFLGGYLVGRLAANPDIERVVAVDSRAPSKAMLRRMGRAEFLRLDIRRPAIAKAIANYEVDTVVHAATSLMDSASHSAAIKELNVVGTMQVCAACQRSPSVKRLILRSSAMVYGASSADPVYFTEGTAARREPKRGYGRDMLDVEGYARGLSRRRQDIEVTILRPQAILGPQIVTRMSAYLAMPLVPVVFGHQARLQFLHEEDALGALEHATLQPRAGTFNLAAEGVVTLGQAIHRAGHIQLPVPGRLLAPLVGVLRDARVPVIRSEQESYLSYGRVLDTTRMRTELGFTPRYTTRETLDDFIARGRTQPVIGTDAWRAFEDRAVSTATALL